MFIPIAKSRGDKTLPIFAADAYVYERTAFMLTSQYQMTMRPDLERIYNQLYSYCKTLDFAGYDPFDGLSSRFFRATPLNHFRAVRLGWLQMVKRFPYDLRPALGVLPGVNPKGLALFALAEFSRFETTGDGTHAESAKDLVDRMLDTEIAGQTPDGRATTSFGYNFDWQSRSFYAPAGTPAIVPTAFAARALVEAYLVFDEKKYLNAAIATCDFILYGLNRPVEVNDEVCFSYTPIDQSIVYNASLLAGETLASVGSIIEDADYIDLAKRSARFVLRRQRADGAWIYGANSQQVWVDNFHTAYILMSLFRISGCIPELREETHDAIESGVCYWLDNFFLDDGTPKYYDTSVYPVDIHSAAAAIIALCELRAVDDRMLPMAAKVAGWTVANMHDDGGFFYYQKRAKSTITTPFMRWGQAWMAYALARLIECEAPEPGKD